MQLYVAVPPNEVFGVETVPLVGLLRLPQVTAAHVPENAVHVPDDWHVAVYVVGPPTTPVVE